MRPAFQPRSERRQVRWIAAGLILAAVLTVLAHVPPFAPLDTRPHTGPTPGLTPPACCAAPCPGHMSDGCGGAHATP